MMEQGWKRQTVFNFIVLCPIFLVFSLLLSNWWEGRRQDFGAYWQAGHMLVAGQNVYDRAQWMAVRESEQIAFHSEPTFQYPLPLAVMFMPVALLPIQTAYTLWMFFAQVAVLASIVILLRFYPARSGYFELMAIAGIFFFRPMFTVINSGQILTFLLLLLALSIRSFENNNWFMGGFLLSAFSLKPSIGFPILLLAGLWLLSRKQWKGIAGMITGGLALVVLGALVNGRWVIDYLSIGGDSFSKYYGMHPTLWGAVDKILKINRLSIMIGLICVTAVIALEAYLFWKRKPDMAALPAFASIVPAGLLVAPYSWHHDQILLVVPILFVLITIAMKYGAARSGLFMVGVIALAYAMLTVAYQVGHDVWSVMNTFVVWIASLYFVSNSHPLHQEQTVLSLNRG